MCAMQLLVCIAITCLLAQTFNDVLLNRGWFSTRSLTHIQRHIQHHDMVVLGEFARCRLVEDELLSLCVPNVELVGRHIVYGLCAVLTRITTKNCIRYMTVIYAVLHSPENVWSDFRHVRQFAGLDLFHIGHVEQVHLEVQRLRNLDEALELI